MAHSLIMPKQAGKSDVFYASLEIFYESRLRGEEWCENGVFKDQIIRKCPRIARDTVLNGPYLVKQSELVRYFGLAEYEYGHQSGRARITERGIRFYDAYRNHNINKQRSLLMESILNDSFGRNNTAIESSDSDVDAPKLFLKACNDLRGITRIDLAYLLYVTHDKQIRYEDALAEFNSAGSDKEISIPANVSHKYSDVKFTVLLTELGIVTEIDRKYYLSQYTRNNYLIDVERLTIYNTIPSIIYSMLNRANEEPDDFTDEDGINQQQILTSFGYDIASARFLRENNRQPEPLTLNSNKYKTNPRIAKTALVIADFKCEINKADHITFISKNGRQFMEAHHLIPMHAQKDFGINLDRIENIVCICPNCHSAIHLGTDSVRLDYLKRLYDQRINGLRAVGIDISFGDLFSKYYR
ncbi:MAG: HNH endonuclease [Bacilli bacterium]|nr:HNH endonuclease [Bacilli bacterium]